MASSINRPPGQPVEERSDDLANALHTWFGFREFRSGQREVIEAVMRRERVMAMLPTGAGKSLCYQLPAMLLPGTTLVISPLIALMKDQIDSLPPAVQAQSTLINSTLDPATLAQRSDEIAAGRYKLVYIAPERLRQRPFLHVLARATISLVVIDEAHCISMWGNDFRPDYLFIAKALPLLGNPPILAMSATLTPAMRDEIVGRLGQSLTFISGGTFRPNLRMEVHPVGNEDDRLRLLVDVCRQEPGPGIVYARSREKCETIAGVLRHRGIPAAHYHAGMESETRSATQDAFMNGQVRVIVATVAFGMGVDKANVRYVIHYNLPHSLEGYYQEAGRAGRDGQPARCILLYSKSDKTTLIRWLRDERLSVDELRSTFAALRQLVSDSAGHASFVRSHGAATGLVALDDLYRTTQLDETRLRVAISMLERVGLVERHFDLPRSFSVTLLPVGAKASGEQTDESWNRWLQATQLRPNRAQAYDTFSLCEMTGIAVESIEEQLLAWSTQGRLRYSGSGRDMLITLHRAPDGLRKQIAELLDRYEQTQLQRIEIMADYAAQRRCRHGMIGRHFGTTAMQRCNVCDACEPKALQAARSSEARQQSRAATHPNTPPPASPALAVLQCLREMPWQTGRTGLVRTLRGSLISRVSPEQCPSFGTLAGMSEGAVIKLVEQLIDAGYIDRDVENEYRFLSLNRKGRDALDAGELEGAETVEIPAPAGYVATSAADLNVEEQATFEALRRWREQVARLHQVPAFCILHNTVLYALAQQQPQTLHALRTIKGIGPRKLAEYGDTLLTVIKHGYGEQHEQA